MITLQRDKQKMKYALYGREVEIPQYYEDEDGNLIEIESGETQIVYNTPVEFTANINNKLAEVLIREFGIDDTTKFSQIVTSKGYLPLEVGSLIWKKSEVMYTDVEQTIPDETSADYKVMGIADEGLEFDLYLLQRNV